MARDPKRIKIFLGRFYSWYEATYKATHPRFSNASFWIVGAMLARFDAILGAGVGRSLNTKGLAEELAFQMLDLAAKSGVRMDWPTFSRSWRGLAVKCGIKPETIAASYAKKPKGGNREQMGGVRDRDIRGNDLVGVVPRLRRIENVDSRERVRDGDGGSRETRKRPSDRNGLLDSRGREGGAGSASVGPSTERDFALSTWALYRRNRKPKSDAELIEFHRTKCAALKAEKVGAA